MNVVIAGAGPGGLAAAIALARKGVEVDLYERSPQLRAAGGPIVLWPYAVRRLLDLVGVLDVSAQTYAHVHTRGWDARLVRVLPAEQLIGRSNAPIVALPRSDLIRCLAEHQPKPIHLGTAVVGLAQGPEQVVVHLSDGTTRTCDALLGADGSHSEVRTALHGPLPICGTEIVAWLGMSTTGLRASPDTLTSYLGQGKRFLHLPTRDGAVWWYAYVQASASPADATDLRTVFRHWAPAVIDAIDATEPAQILRVPVSDRPPLPRWGQGRVTLLGDAAHTCTPDLGQGACLALEDAATLASTLRDDIPAWLAAYETARRRHATGRQHASRAASDLSMPDDAVGNQLRELATRVAPDAVTAAVFGWLFSGG